MEYNQPETLLYKRLNVLKQQTVRITWSQNHWSKLAKAEEGYEILEMENRSFVCYTAIVDG